MTSSSSKSSPSNPWQLATFLLGGLLMGFLLSSSFSGDGFLANLLVKLRERTPTVDDDPSFGALSAPITMIEFSDYQCPYCEDFYKKKLPQIKANYLDTGKVRLVYRDYPLEGHANADNAAEAAECARVQNPEMYWAMHDALFETVPNWRASQDVNAIFVGYAEALGLDKDAFSQCLNGREKQAEVVKDLIDGLNGGVGGTPTFFINGKKVIGSEDYEVFAALFDSILGPSLPQAVEQPAQETNPPVAEKSAESETPVETEVP